MRKPYGFTSTSCLDSTVRKDPDQVFCRESPTTKKVCCKEFATHLVLIRHSATFHASADTSGIFFKDRLSSRATVSAAPPVSFSCGHLLPTSPTDFSSKSYSSSPPPSSSPPRVFGGKKGIRTPETLLRFTRFPGGPVQPLLHLSV